MASQTLETLIRINAQTGSGFGEVGSTLSNLASMVTQLSTQLIQFGTESVEVYREYEKSMADAQVALSTTYGRNTSELSRVMNDLDVAATEWAASTIFHTDDVANAISEAAHAGWDYEQIMSGIPAAMELAQAGSLDLSQAVNYIVKSTNAAGIEFDQTGDLIDKWTFAANSSATTVEEMGEAMLKMGATMKFAGGTEEFLTLIAATANAGVTGSEAGTMIRNAMLRLIAPTNKAEDALAELGATSDEATSLLNDEALVAAGEQLEAVGFSAYDSEGNLKNMIEIYGDLNNALAEIAGGAENISTNQDALNIISAIFPTRTITEALALMDAAQNNWYGIYDALEGGDAADYGSYAAETMMDTLDGAIETFGSKVERLKQLVGEDLAPQVESVLGFMGGIVDNIAELDDAKFSALVGGLEAIAVLGPAFGVAAAGIKLISLAMNPAGAIALGAMALVSAASAVQQLAEVNYENLFGTGEIDGTEIAAFLDDIAQGYSEAYAEIDEFRAALDNSVQSYTTASQEFSSKLLSKAITGNTLTDADIAEFENLGDTMYNAVLTGIENSAAGSMSYWELMFGGAGVAENDVNYQNLINMENDSYQELIATAEGVGKELRAAMSAAFSDGTIDDDEYQSILEYVRSYNAAIAAAQKEAQDEQDYADLQALLHKGQTASLDEIKSTSKSITSQRDDILARQEDEYLQERYKAEYHYNKSIDAETDPNKKAALVSERDSTLSAADQQYSEQVTSTNMQYADALFTLWDSQIKQSDLAGAYEELTATATDVLHGVYSDAVGYTYLSDANEYYQGGVSSSEQRGILKTIPQMVSALGGYEAIKAMAASATASGNTELASNLQTLITQYGILSNTKTGTIGLEGTDDLADVRETIDSYVAENPIMFDVKINGDSITEGLEGIDYEPIPVNITTDESGMENLNATIDGADGKELMAYVNGDTADLEMSITDQDGQTLVENVTGNASSLSAIIDSYNGRTITVNIKGNNLIGNIPGAKFAEGGRATVASIFGEAGPEWAIPEEHSERTANLLNAAREASGFTWPELLSRFGGLNANANNQPTTLVYSPTITAADSSGVEQVLREDKSRLEKWFSEKKMFENVEVYA